MSLEYYCAQRIGILEGEQFIAVGERVAHQINPDYEAQRQSGLAPRLPDLISSIRDGDTQFYRVREVKFKLEEKLVRKALDQLSVGARHLHRHTNACLVIDRFEIVVPLKSRRLKEEEKSFLGKEVGHSRYRLRLDGLPVSLRLRGKSHAVSVLILP